MVRNALIVCYKIGSNQGSEAESAYQIVRKIISAGVRVTLITRPNSIALLKEDPNFKNVTLISVELPVFFRLFKKGTVGDVLFCYLWQVVVGFKVRKLQRIHRFAVLHQLTPLADWVPHFIKKKKSQRLIWGPVGHRKKTPFEVSRNQKRYRYGLGETVKWLGKQFFWRFDLNLRSAIRRTDVIFYFSSDLAPPFLMHRNKVKVLSGEAVTGSIVLSYGDYAPSSPNDVKTYYKVPHLNRITGKHTVTWKTSYGEESICAHSRLTDFEGNRPSLYSVLNFPGVIKTYLESRKGPILKKPQPFIVMDAIRFMEHIVKDGMKVLEFGGGNSTLWFLGRHVQLTTVEHSKEWSEIIQRNAAKAPNFQILNLSGEAALSYVTKIEDQSLDIVLVDCANSATSRNEVIRTVRSKIKPGGWLVLDNSDHPNNWGGVDLMSDLDQIWFTGYGPMSLFVSQTSFWRVR